MNDCEVWRTVLDLSDTVHEALEYMRQKMDQLRFESAYAMLDQVLIGLARIDQELSPMLKELPDNDLPMLSEELFSKLEYLTRAYQRRDTHQIGFLLPNVILPSYRAWQLELQRCVMPYVIV